MVRMGWGKGRQGGKGRQAQHKGKSGTKARAGVQQVPRQAMGFSSLGGRKAGGGRKGRGRQGLGGRHGVGGVLQASSSRDRREGHGWHSGKVGRHSRQGTRAGMAGKGRQGCRGKGKQEGRYKPRQVQAACMFQPKWEGQMGRQAEWAGVAGVCVQAATQGQAITHRHRQGARGCVELPMGHAQAGLQRAARTTNVSEACYTQVLQVEGWHKPNL